mmetsp:Transcript_68387/g.196152  ORF Transcript_68387/g.196152 Transcript_68387/m.196152 type:complete len:579 (+) Transcript_68387:929-2665(+)
MAAVDVGCGRSAEPELLLLVRQLSFRRLCILLIILLHGVLLFFLRLLLHFLLFRLRCLRLLGLLTLLIDLHLRLLLLLDLFALLFDLLALLLLLLALLHLDRSSLGLLLGLLFSRLHLLVAQRDRLLPQLVCLLGLVHSILLLLLVLQQLLLLLLFEVGRGLAHGHLCDLLEARGVEALEDLLAVRLNQVLLDLHDHVVPGHGRRNGVQRTADAEVIHASDPEVEVGFVVAALPALLPGHPQAALARPLQDLAVAQLSVARVLRVPRVQGIEGALVREGDRQDDLILASLWLRLLCNHDVGLCRTAKAAALEGQRPGGLGAECNLHRDVAEGHVWEKGLTVQTFGDGLRLRDALTIAEQAQSVHVGARRVQIQENTNDLVAGEFLRAAQLLLPARAEVAFGIEADVRILAVSEHQRGAGRGEADLEQLPRCGNSGAQSGIRRLCGVKRLDDPDLEHVPPSLHAHIRAGTCDEVLHATLCQSHEYSASHGDDVQGRVLRAEADGLLDGRALVRRAILLRLGSAALLLLLDLDLGDLLRGLLCGYLLRLSLLRLGDDLRLLSSDSLGCCLLLRGHGFLRS